MRILFLGNNRVGWQVVRWLREQNEEIVGLIVHPSHKQRYRDEIIRSAEVRSEHIFDALQLRERDVLKAVNGLHPDTALSVFFGYILRPEFISLFPAGVINLHPSYLPYNRGQYPNVWSIVERTPAGATLHYIDAGVDTGDIIARRRVHIEPVDTGKTLYRRLERACFELFKETWPLIRLGQIPRIPQDKRKGRLHRTCDVERIDCIDLDRKYTANELINIIRARTFPPYPGAYFVHQGRKVFLRLQLFYEEQSKQVEDEPVH